MKRITILLAVLLLLLTACQSETPAEEENTPPADDVQQDDKQGEDVQDTDDAKNNDADDNTGGTAAGTWALDINTVDLNGLPVTSADFADNKLTILNVWATWCGPCVSELPELELVAAAFKDQGVQVVGVLQDGASEKDNSPLPAVISDAQKLLSDAGTSYLMILPDEALNRAFINDMQAFPTTFFLNDKGEVIHQEIGSQDFEGWSAVINDVLENMD